ncbi:MAG: condensation domain-containing protein, partial [Psychrosphaera sp.]|nr:condensation domain-containing protein [Psychrosphaera sp.]
MESINVGKANLTALQNDFDLEGGPLWRAAHLTGYEDGSQRLFFAFHHLIIDTVSWRIIASDLEQLLTGQSLGKKTSSYRQWVDAVHNYSQTHTDEKAYWDTLIHKSQKLQNRQVLPAPVEPEHHQISFTPAQTQALLNQAGKGYHTQINDLLLSALAIALQEFFGHHVNHITLEGHGREAIDPTLDLTRTVGWFTTLYPVALTAGNTVEKTIIQTKEMLRAIPNNGIGYGGLLQGESNASALPPISFNYLGQFEQNDQHGQKIADWQILTDDCGQTIAPENADNLLLNIYGAVQQGTLNFDIHAKVADSQQFAESFKTALIAVINAGVEAAQGGGVHTPSDYGVDNLSIERLEDLQAKHDIEAIYPATSLQQGFIYHHLSQPNDDAYRVQLLLDYNDRLDIDKYQQAWQLASLRYPILRTAFDWQDEVIQVTSKAASITPSNFCFIDLAEQDLSIEAIQQQDRTVAFDLTQPGLIRFTIIKQNDHLYTVLQSLHHAITDGWSNPILL